MLSHQDSNLGKQNQNLMCYHYTMGQSIFMKEFAKVLLFCKTHKNKFRNRERNIENQLNIKIILWLIFFERELD